ncbi:MAG: ParB N-terminal domain-containing protein [Spirochaetales bacterium]|nr:ParB N-terminal domain-containing protein [Spirochaetales bacterium]
MAKHKSRVEKAKDWLSAQQSRPRPGSLPAPVLESAPAQGVALSAVIEWVSPADLRPNARNDFAPLLPEEYARLRDDIERNGILDPLTARRDGLLITGENRFRIANELSLSKIPVRFYLRELSPAEEYDLLEADNLLRRHLSPAERKARIKARIKRKYADRLAEDRRGGDRKTERSRSKIHSESLIPEANNLARTVATEVGIPRGTAQRYIAELRKTTSPQPTTPTGPQKTDRSNRRTDQKLESRQSNIRNPKRSETRPPPSVLKTIRFRKSILKELAGDKQESRLVLRELDGLRKELRQQVGK